MATNVRINITDKLRLASDFFRRHILRPRLHHEEKRAAESQAARQKQIPSQRNILIVDDDADLRWMYATMVGGCQFSAVTASDGLEALEEFRKGGIDLVLMDKRMPNMDGEQALGLMLQMDMDAKVVINSADADEETARRLIRAGARAVLRKPVSMPIIQKVISKVLEGGQGIIISGNLIQGIEIREIFKD